MSAKQPPSSAAGSAPSDRTALFGGATNWVAAHPWKAGLTGVVAVSLINAIVIAWVVLRAQRDSDDKVTAPRVLEALDRRQLQRAQTMAQQLRDEANGRLDALSVAAFVDGAVAVYDIDEQYEQEKTATFLLAARYLEESRERGFPAGHEAEGLFLLGKCLFMSGQYAASRPILLEALEVNAPRQSLIHLLLARAHQKDAQPDYAQALVHNSKFLDDRRIPPERRYEAILQRSQLLFALGRNDECRAALEGIPADHPLRAEATIIEGRLELAQGQSLARTAQSQPSTDSSDQPATRYRQAIEVFRRAQGRETPGNESTRQALYLIGVCYSELDDLKAAYEQLNRVRSLYASTPEGLAADLLLGEVLCRLDRNEEGVAAFQRTLVAAGDPLTYSNPWVALDELRARLVEAYHKFVKGGQFDLALQLLEKFVPIQARELTMELEAQAYRAWADVLLADAERAAGAQSQTLRARGSALLRKAGETYGRLAKSRSTSRAYPDDVWNAAINLLQGHDYPSAAAHLNEYLKVEQRRRRAQALLGLGKARLATGDVKGSITVFKECIDNFPRDSAIYDARLWCSKACRELDDQKQAEELLLANLGGDTLTPASREWRDSLFALGELLYVEGRYEEAIQKLEEAVERYPDTAQTAAAQYTIAESYRSAAELPQKRLREATIESVRSAQRKQIRRLMEGALTNFLQVRDGINRREELAELGELERAMLRNCYFSIGSVLFDMGRYQEAIKAYSDASTRYQHEPIVLEALLQIADSHRRLNRPVEARGALEQAKVVWKRLPAEADFSLTTNYSRAEWITLLDQLSSW